jgi:hypothetical protein
VDTIYVDVIALAPEMLMLFAGGIGAAVVVVILAVLKKKR